MFIAVALFALGCLGPQSPKPPKPPDLSNQLLNRPTPRPINSIRVGNFQCGNEVTAQAVRNVFMEMLVRNGDVKVGREGEADIVIEGTVTLARGDSSSASIGGGVGKGQSVAGEYVSGVTSLALRDGGILTSASWGQNFGKGVTLLPPESVARNAANSLLGQLAHEGLKRRR